MAPQQSIPNHVSSRWHFADRLLAESAAALDRAAPDRVDDAVANALAQDHEGPFELRVLKRARHLPVACALGDALRHTISAIWLAVAIAGIVAFLAGVAAARAGLGTPRTEPVNIFHLLTIMLLPQSILLLAWIGVMILPRHAASLLSVGSLGGVVMRLGQWATERIHRGRIYQAATAAISQTMLSHRLGWWTLSAISHGLWLAFNAGSLATLLFMLSIRQYAFAWETTILSERAYLPLTRAIAVVPRAAGFSTPTEAQVQNSQWRGIGSPDMQASQAWAGLLVGSLIMYGLAPRLLLFGLCLGQRRGAKAAYRLDVERPDFARLRGILEPSARHLGIVDADAPPAASPTLPRGPTSRPEPRPSGAPAIVAFEVAPPLVGQTWPPHVDGVRWHDLGLVDGREQRQRVIHELGHGPHSPAELIVVCSLTTTPDRGVAAFLAEIAGMVMRPPILLLTGGQRLRERGDVHQFDTRLDDWHRVAHAAGIPNDRVAILDLEHLTNASRARLASLLQIPVPTVSTARIGLDQAIAHIREFVDKRAVDHQAQVELHRNIASAFGHRSHRWRVLLAVPDGLASMPLAQWSEHLSTAGRNLTNLLPARLQRSPRWLAAGASAGALACVTAAALISPVAIGALPIWSGIGAALAAVMQPGRPSDEAPSGQRTVPGLDAAVRSAALFALVLELQGRDERVITRVLDRCLAEDDVATARLDDPGHVGPWLEDIQHRLDIALARESSA